MDSLIAVKISIILHRSIREELYDGIQAEDQIRGSTRPGLRSREMPMDGKTTIQISPQSRMLSNLN